MVSINRISLNFDELTTSYETGLVDKLRHFGMEAELLDTWVPDFDPVKSFLNLVDSAQQAKLEGELEIRVANSTLDDQALDRIKADLQGRLSVEYVKETDSAVLLVSGFGNLATDTTIPLYIRKSEVTPNVKSQSQELTSCSSLQKTPLATVHDVVKAGSPVNSIYDLPVPQNSNRYRVREKAAGLVKVSTSYTEIELEVLVDPDKHLVENMSFTGNLPDNLRGLADRFCELVQYYPFQEVSDHGVLRLEYALRGNVDSRPVSGIVLATTVDHRFKIINTLVREAFLKYCEIADFSPGHNDFEVPPNRRWVALSNVERQQHLQTTLDECLYEMGIGKNQIEVLKIDYIIRVLVRFKDKLLNPELDKQAVIMRLEQYICEKLEPRLELLLEPVQDLSKLRRLTATPAQDF